ncbi:hypothetical protein [Nocardia suismassiliense]|uniref:hypothetical protein n=1 Tax=Nocardia suismassiliense TaxID=2077092 RepID=UPI000D1F09ED|nr:hypothetical protein [Nocardia suismassiliense]
MVHQGKALGVDLHRLEQAAKVHFPAVSADYGEAIGKCDQVRGQIEQAMRRPEQFGGDTLGPVYHAYLDLHDTVMGFLKETRTNLDDTATALHRAAQIFAGMDRKAGDEMNRLVRNDPELDGKR